MSAGWVHQTKFIKKQGVHSHEKTAFRCSGSRTDPFAGSLLHAPETKEYTTEELSQILSSAISENSDGMADVITTDSLNAAIDWLTTNKGMSEDEANTFMEEYNALPYEDIDATLTEKGFTAEEIASLPAG